MKQFFNGHFLHIRLRKNPDQEFSLLKKSLGRNTQQAVWPLERMLNWFLLCWLGLVYAQGFLFLAGSQSFHPFQNAICLSTFPQQYACIFTGIFVLLHNLPRAMILSLFTFVMILHALLLWVGLERKIRRYFFYLFFVLQGTFFLVACFIEQQIYGDLSLYLVLLLGALSMFKRVRPVFIILCCYSVLFLSFSYSLFFSMQILYKQGLVNSVPVWDITNYTALILFVIGYLMLYMQQRYAHMQLAIYATRVEELTRLTERQHLARELHDTLSQGLVGLSLQLDAVDALLTRQRPERAQEIVRQAMKRVRHTLADTRSSLDNLRSEEKPASDTILFSESVREQIELFTSSIGLACKTDISISALLPSSLYEPMLRIIAEGLTNIARHAQAHQAEIRIYEQEYKVMIDVSDDGIGFDPTIIHAKIGHYGLLGLRERVHSLGGRMTIDGAPGGGTTLHVMLPIMRSV